MIFNMSGGGGGVSLDVIAVSELPATVVENQIVVITDTPAGTIYVDTDEPANPVSGDVWVQVGSSDTGLEFSETFRNGLMQAAQYSGGWNTLAGHVGINVFSDQHHAAGNEVIYVGYFVVRRAVAAVTVCYPYSGA